MSTNAVIPFVLVLIVAAWVLGGAVQRREGFRRQVVAEYERIVACWNLQASQSSEALYGPSSGRSGATDDPAWRLAVATVVADREGSAVLRGQVGRELHRRGY